MDLIDMLNIVIGERSNLSLIMKKTWENIFFISSKSVKEKGICIKNEDYSVIFNNFHPAIDLNSGNYLYDYVDNCIGITALILQKIEETGFLPKKILYTSSASVYGNQTICKEDMNPSPVSLQASLKLANEKLIERFCKKNSIDYTIARVFNIFGGFDRFSIIYKIINAIKNKTKLTLINNGVGIRDFIHVEDVSFLYKKLIKTNGNPIVNIASGCNISVSDIIGILIENNYDIKLKNLVGNEVEKSIADLSLLKSIIGEYKFIHVDDFLLHTISC